MNCGQSCWNRCKPIFSKIVSLHAENNRLLFAVPEGLMGVGTKIDPAMQSRSSGRSSVGCGREAPEGSTPSLKSVCSSCAVCWAFIQDKEQTKVSKLAKNDILLINIGSTLTGGRVLSMKGDLITSIQLTSPACTEVGKKGRTFEMHREPLTACWESVQHGTVLELD
ncbi:putative eukaryotic translation initiation factor 2 gamma subunit [Suillus subluteus]|nr:putative eukaryotic translation initiation factor 2 gamma subunit [Suillus subluteus]